MTADTAARVPHDMRIYAIGDVHGRADLFDDMMQLISRDSNAASSVHQTIVVCLGDYVDRGPDSSGVIDRLLKAKARSDFRTFFLKGNHEVMFLDFLAGTTPFFHWAANGGVATLQSYDIDMSETRNESPERLRQTALAAIPQSHLTLLRGLDNAVIIGDYLFVHAGIRPGVPLDAQSESDLVWIREPFLDHGGDFGKIVVHGHTPVPRPETLANRIAIDTFAWRSGRLTALVLEGGSRRFLQT